MYIVAKPRPLSADQSQALAEVAEELGFCLTKDL